jgi:hypothetical protein
MTDDRAVILEGMSAGETVATHGNFLIDSQMQLAGNPSLMDPSRASMYAPGPLTLPPSQPIQLAGESGDEFLSDPSRFADSGQNDTSTAIGNPLSRFGRGMGCVFCRPADRIGFREHRVTNHPNLIERIQGPARNRSSGHRWGRRRFPVGIWLGEHGSFLASTRRVGI